MMKMRLLILTLAALCVGVAPAMAGLAVVVDSSQTKLTVASKTSANDLFADVAALDTDSDMTLKVQIPATIDGVKLDSYTMDLKFHFLGAGSVYTANGTFKLQDHDATTLWDLQANFASTNVALVEIAGDYRLEVQGNLSTVVLPSILQGSDPWVFKGDSQTGAGDADGNPLTITVSEASGFDTGGLVALHYPVYGSFTDLEDLFASLGVGSVLDNGSLHAQVTPVPAAVLLGMLGLGVAGLKLRKYA